MVLFMGDFFFYDFKVYLQNPLFSFTFFPFSFEQQESGLSM